LCSFLETSLRLVPILLAIGQLCPVLEKLPLLLGAQLRLECVLQTTMRDSLLPAKAAAAHISTSAGNLALFVDANLAFRCAHDADEFSLWSHLSALNAGAHRHMFWCHVGSAILAAQLDVCETDAA